MDMSQKPQNIRAKLGALFGCIAGLIFSFVAWGFDALSIANSHGVLPWLKFLIGSVCVIFLYGVAGFFSAKHGGFLLTIVCFITTALVSAWLVAHLPYEGMNIGIKIFYPLLPDLASHVFHEAAQARFILTTIVFSVIALLSSLFFDNLINQAYAATSRVATILPLIIFSIFFVTTGFIGDYFNNRPFNQPMAQINSFIQKAQSIQQGRITLQPSEDTWADTFLRLNIDLDVPYRVITGEIDPTFSSAQVFVQFSKTWYECLVVLDQPFLCRPHNP